jgi:hypothetical protein
VILLASANEESLLLFGIHLEMDLLKEKQERSENKHIPPLLKNRLRKLISLWLQR